MNYSKLKTSERKIKAWSEMQKQIKEETQENNKTQIMQKACNTSSNEQVTEGGARKPKNSTPTRSHEKPKP